MSGILYTALRYFRLAWSRVSSFISNLGWKKASILGVLIVIVIVGGFKFLHGSSVAPTTEQSVPSVTVSSVADLMQGGSSLSIAGTVQSQSEASVRAEKSGQVTAVYYALGDYVSAGAVVAQMENASERAAVQQAQGAVDAATAGGNVSQTTLAGARSSTVTALLSAYASTDSNVKGGADPMFSNPGSVQPQLNVQSADSQAKIDSETGRTHLTPILIREQARSTNLASTDDLIAEATKTEAELRVVRDFFDTLIRALNAGIATYAISDATLAADKATATAARTAITGALSALAGARQALDTAQQNAAQNGSAPSASQASLTQAQGALAAARANLEKSIIRAPISGTINSLPLKRGDFLQAFSPALTVANNHALEVLAYVTQNDAKLLSVGSKTTVDTTTSGVITRIAPAIDPLTKKIEVRIGIVGTSALVNGQAVSISLTNNTKPTANGPAARLTIPLAALKIGADDMSVFTVGTSSMLEAHPVKIGELLGDKVVVTEGITPDMRIVTDVRGLRAGQTVVVR